MPMSPEQRQAASDRMKAMHAAKRPAPVTPPPVKLSSGGAQAGIQQPEGWTPRVKPITLLSDDVAENDLDELGVNAWIKKHYIAMDVNIDGMARILREDREDIYDRLHALDFPLPEGTYRK